MSYMGKLSPLYYPGAKAKLKPHIIPFLYKEMREFREPFCGSAEIALTVRKMYPHVKVWINDKDEDLIAFFRVAQKDAPKLHAELDTLRRTHSTIERAKELFDRLLLSSPQDEFERAVRYYVINRTCMLGREFKKRFDFNRADGWVRGHALHRVLSVQPLLDGVTITCSDYADVCSKDGEDVFMFLDPPYVRSEFTRCYSFGEFDHEALFSILRTTHHGFLMTIDAIPEDMETSERFFTKHLYYHAEGFYGHKKTHRYDLLVWNYVVDAHLMKEAPLLL